MTIRERVARLFHRPVHRHLHPTPMGDFRMVLLDDEPYPTYIGTRPWCNTLPYWEDRTCKCTHTEHENA